MRRDTSMKLLVASMVVVPGIVLAQTRVPLPVPTSAAPISAKTAPSSGTPTQSQPTTAPAPIAASRPDAARPPSMIVPSCDKSPNTSYEVDASGQTDVCAYALVDPSCDYGVALEIDENGNQDLCARASMFPPGNQSRVPCRGTQIDLVGRDKCKSPNPAEKPQCLLAGARVGSRLVGSGRDTCGPSARCEALPLQIDASGTSDACYAPVNPRCEGTTGTLAADYCVPTMMMGFATYRSGCTGNEPGRKDVCTRQEGSETKVSPATCPQGTWWDVRSGMDHCRSNSTPPLVCPAGTRVVPVSGPDECLP